MRQVLAGLDHEQITVLEFSRGFMDVLVTGGCRRKLRVEVFEFLCPVIAISLQPLKWSPGIEYGETWRSIWVPSEDFGFW
jgi:hypothetical protein